MMSNAKTDRLKRVLQRKSVLLLLLLAAALRFIYIFSAADQSDFFDTVHYDTAAKSLVAGQGFGPSLHYYDRYKQYSLEPAYPLFLAAVYTLFGQSHAAVRIVQVLLSLLHIYLVYLITRRLRPAASLIALAFAAVYPFFIFITGLLYSTQLFALLLTLAIFGFLRYAQTFSFHWLSLGAVALGLSMVTIPVIMPAAPLIVLWLFFLPRGHLKERLQRTLWPSVLLMLVLAPWTIRNYLVFGTFSPGRACLAETRAFEQVELQFRYEDALKRPYFDGRTFSVDILKDDRGRTLFRCSLDGRLLEILKVPEDDWTLPDSTFFGLMAYGGSKIGLPSISFSDRNGDPCPASETVHSPELSYDNGAVLLQQSPAGWEYGLVFTRPAAYRRMTMTWPDSVAPQDMQRFAFWIGLEQPSLTADGYMIWLHFWRNSDLWQVCDGKPSRRLDFVDLQRKQNPTTLKALIIREPIRYFTRHFFPELLKFWSPIITRITTEERRPGAAMQAVSVIFLTPLLIFALIGVSELRRADGRNLLLVLIPVAVLAIGYALFFVEVRYRIPIDGFLIILAAVGFRSVNLLRKMRRH